MDDLSREARQAVAAGSHAAKAGGATCTRASAPEDDDPLARGARPPNYLINSRYEKALGRWLVGSARSRRTGGTTPRSIPTLIDEAARLTPRDLRAAVAAGLHAWSSTTRSKISTSPKRSNTSMPGGRAPTTIRSGICGPIGPTEQLPLVARIVNALELDVRSGHFWGMDEWFDVATGSEVAGHASADLREGRPRDVLQPHRREAADARRDTCTFPKADTARLPEVLGRRRALRGDAGRQGDVKHWAFNDPLPRRATTRTRRRRQRSIASSPRASSICIR